MRSSLRGLLVGLAILLVPAASQAATISYQSSSEQQVLGLINQIRQQHHLARLTLSAPLRGAARAHSLDMLQNAYFDHAADEGDDGSSLSGETIAWGVGSYATPSGLVGQWMRSAPHRALLLAPGMRRVGIGIALGTYGSTRNAVMATADFSN
jgi:uncharacterized protein YkwD